MLIHLPKPPPIPLPMSVTARIKLGRGVGAGVFRNCSEIRALAADSYYRYCIVGGWCCVVLCCVVLCCVVFIIIIIIIIIIIYLKRMTALSLGILKF